MTYLYENLSPERFQQLCQALIVTQFPETQCLPVGQPDGGRDAFFWRRRPKGKSELVIFQVKFGRSSTDRAKEFIEEVSKSELRKVKRLITRGAKAYYLLTNIQRTSHLDIGSIDRMDNTLSESLGIPAFCWWRDDLDRRIDGTLDLKWSFPEIISAADLLPVLLQSITGDESQRRDNAIQAYLADQYDDDKEVKFKQVDLYNNLLDLFIDVPITYLGNHDGPYLRSGTMRRRIDEYTYIDESVGAADYLLGVGAVRNVPRIVLQGAPGQGKSTITQYICQVQRMRLLNRTADLERIKSDHRTGDVRLPFRIDLRDYASWVGGNDPFALDMKAPRPQESNTSLESFLAYQIAHQSGGHKFTVSDFAAIAKVSPLLVVLDGFDEVANVPLREILIREITKSVTRLETTALSIQAVVTSRPAAFANSPGFPEKLWSHFSLQSLAINNINEYAEKWMKARVLSANDASDFRSLLSQKLDQPHMRDLARNPMQLAILLNLIHKRGLSLPDKRTSLYDNYMELFFNREAEKSPIVRERRDLLIDLHMYLAWLLHGEAESEEGTGSITDERLRVVLKDYLRGEGHDTSLVDDLFAGTVERVGAIVSRVEGTYEFEVQPLREYFTARYLYDTAPHSPPGNEKRGTKPERFDALARNFYWLNVTRFYCGCFSRGELSSIVDSLELLNQSPYMKEISYPKLLALMLLGDWVFSQQPFTVERVVKFVTAQPGFKAVSAALNRENSSASLELPERCGRAAILSMAKGLFVGGQRDEQRAVAPFLRSTLSGTQVSEFWLGLDSRRANEDRWLAQGSDLGLFDNLSVDEALDLYRKLGSKIAKYLLMHDRGDALQADSNIFSDAVDIILSLGGQAGRPASVKDNKAPIISHFAIACDPYTYVLAFHSQSKGVPLAHHLRQVRYRMPLEFAPAASLEGVVGHDLLKRVDQFTSVFQEQLDQSTEAWTTTLSPWSAVIGSGLQLFGDQWAFTEIACISAGIRSATEKGKIGRDLFDPSIPLCERARYARFRSGAPTWWKTQIEAADTGSKLRLALAYLFCLGALRVILYLNDVVSGLLSDLDDDGWLRLTQIVGRARRLQKARLTSGDAKALRKASPQIVALVSLREGDSDSRLSYEAVLRDYAGDDVRVLPIAADRALTEALQRPQEWEAALSLVKRAYRAGIVTERAIVRYAPASQLTSMPLAAARKITHEPKEYPQRLVGLADAALTREVGALAKHVRQVAKAESWFDDASSAVLPGRSRH